MEKSPEAFRTISEVADDLEVPQHVLRFWESKFNQVKPMKRGGGRRYYRPQDVELLRGIRHLLYGEGYTIRGVQKILKENGISHVTGFANPGTQPAVQVRQTVAEQAAPEVRVKQAGAAAIQTTLGLTREQKQVLQSALYELSEVKKTLDESGE